MRRGTNEEVCRSIGQVELGLERLAVAVMAASMAPINKDMPWSTLLESAEEAFDTHFPKDADGERRRVKHPPLNPLA